MDIVRGFVADKLCRGGSAIAFHESSPAAIGGNGQQPRLEGTGRIPSVQTAERANKHVLSHILGIFPMSQHPETQPKHRALKPFHQTAHACFITAFAAFHKCRIIVGHKHLALGSNFQGPKHPLRDGVSSDITPIAQRRFQPGEKASGGCQPPGYMSTGNSINRRPENVLIRLHDREPRNPGE
jgi:hypothetical protein